MRAMARLPIQITFKENIMAARELNNIKFTKTNGGMGRKADNEDPISGLLMLLPEMSESALLNDSNGHFPFNKIEKPDGTNDLYVAMLRYPESLATLGAGISEQELSMKVSDNTVDEYKAKAASNTVSYHVKEFFRMNPKGTLYLGIKIAGASIAGADISALQNYANGTIRQCGVFSAKVLDELGKYQTECTSLERDYKPLSLIVATPGKTYTVGVDPNDSTAIKLTESPVLSLSDMVGSTVYTSAGRCNVSLLVGCDLDNGLIGKLGHYKYYGCIGTCLGAVSKAAVHECIAWVQKFPLGLKEPGLISGNLISEVSTENQEEMNGNRYIFVRTHVGNADNFFNDSHTLDEPTSDYAYIENVRTIDKACRGVRANLLPYLNSPLKVDAETGQLDPGTVAFLETTAGKALEDMEKAGELSGYRAEIDPEQNVLATSEVEVLIKNVPMGVMRSVHVKIGFTTSL